MPVHRYKKKDTFIRIMPIDMPEKLDLFKAKSKRKNKEQ
jgi:hypothetical protein